MIIKTSRTPKWVDYLEEAVKTSKCKSEAMRKINLSPKYSGNHQTIDKYIKLLNLDTSHFDHIAVRQNQMLNKNPAKLFIAIPDSKVFCINSTVSRKVVRNRYIKKVSPICNGCGIKNVYNNKPITLQLDHINGIRNDNRIDNLRWLCPNCHSQTETWANKRGKIVKNKNPRVKKYKIQWPITDELISNVRKFGYVSVGKTLGVSGNAVKKHLNSLGVILPKYNKCVN